MFMNNISVLLGRGPVFQSSIEIESQVQ